MSRLHELPPDQSAALSLLLRSRRSHGEVAQMLGIEPPAVHDRAHAALTVLAPQLARHLDAQERERIGEYLLGQLPAPQADGVRLELAASEPAREWAAALAGELSEIAGASLPPIPDVQPGAPAQRGPQLVERVSRRGGVLLLAGLLAAVIAVVIVLLTSGGGGGGGNAGTLASSRLAEGTSAGEGHAAQGGLARKGSAGTSAQRRKHGSKGSAGARKGSGAGAAREGVTGEAGGTEAASGGEAQAGGTGSEAKGGSGEGASAAAGTGASEPEPKVEGQIILTPSESGSHAKGVIVLASEGGNRGMLLSAEHLQPTEGFTYVLWLISGEPNVKPLAFEAPPVKATGKTKEAMLAGRPLPEDASAYDRVELTRETAKHPTRPSAEVVLSGEFKAG